MNIIQAITSGLKDWLNFEGRSSRSAYWWFHLAWLIYIACSMGAKFIFGDGGIDASSPWSELITIDILSISAVIDYVLSIAGFSLSARRLHDIGRSGWWQLVAFSIVGIPVVIYWMCKKGSDEENAYGAPAAVQEAERQKVFPPIQSSIQQAFQKLFQFKGVASRDECAYWGLAVMASSSLLFLAVSYLLPSLSLSWVGLILFSLQMILTIPVTTRRLRDVGRSGWWQLLHLTVVGTFMVIYWTLKKEDTGPNRLGKAVKAVFKKGVTFQGRSSRSEYWWFEAFISLLFLSIFFVCVLAVWLAQMFFPALLVGLLAMGVGIKVLFFVVFISFYFYLVFIGLGLQARRLHDINKSGWWQLVLMIPFIGFCFWLLWNCRKGDKGPNRFGEDPLKG